MKPVESSFRCLVCLWRHLVLLWSCSSWSPWFTQVLYSCARWRQQNTWEDLNKEHCAGKILMLIWAYWISQTYCVRTSVRKFHAYSATSRRACLRVLSTTQPTALRELFAICSLLVLHDGHQWSKGLFPLSSGINTPHCVTLQDSVIKCEFCFLLNDYYPEGFFIEIMYALSVSHVSHIFIMHTWFLQSVLSPCSWCASLEEHSESQTQVRARGCRMSAVKSQEPWFLYKPFQKLHKHKHELCDCEVSVTRKMVGLRCWGFPLVTALHTAAIPLKGRGGP
jgi:hypothetical protein